MKKIMTLSIAGTIAVFAASLTFADNSIVSTANMNHVATVSVMQDDDQMGKMKPKKNAGKRMKKMNAKKKTMSMKKKPMKKKSGMGNMKMKDMD